MSETRQLTLLADVQQRAIQWLWQGFVPLGAITDLSGDPGQGKSQIAYDIIARVTTGRPMPSCKSALPPAGAVLLQGEDSLGGTVKPALVAAEGDLARVAVYDATQFRDAPLALPADLPVLEEAIARVEAKLVVIDPAPPFFICNANSESSVRKALMPLAELAARHDLAVLLVRHLNKTTGGNPLYRPGGSIAWSALARSGLRIINDIRTDRPYSHVVVQVKTNLASAPSLAYRTVMDGGQIRVEWTGVSGITMRDLIDGAHECDSRVWEAMKILFLILCEGPSRSREVYERARREGVAKRTLERAKKILGVISERGRDNYGWWWWEWRLPAQDNEIILGLRQSYNTLDQEQCSNSGEQVAPPTHI